MAARSSAAARIPSPSLSTGGRSSARPKCSLTITAVRSKSREGRHVPLRQCWFWYSPLQCNTCPNFFQRSDRLDQILRLQPNAVPCGWRLNLTIRRDLGVHLVKLCSDHTGSSSGLSNSGVGSYRPEGWTSSNSAGLYHSGFFSTEGRGTIKAFFPPHALQDPTLCLE